jgi:hypothetical protein
MPARKPPELWLPPPQRWQFWAIAISLGLHGLIFLIKVKPWLIVHPPEPIAIVLVPPGTETPGQPDIRFEVRGGRPPAQHGPSTQAAPRENPAPAQPEVRPTPEEPRPSQPSPAVAVPPAPAPAPSDSGRGQPRPGAPGYRIGPALGEGKLWVQPLPAPPQEIAEAYNKSHVELVDSAVSAIVQQYIDSVLNAPADPNAALPSWTTKIMGKTFGIDSKFIYLGPLKIPSALLAFLPINGGGLTMEYSKASRMASIRADLVYAAQRSATLDDFKRAVRELRAERERQRELERNQRKTPGDAPKDTTKKVIPPKIP